MNAFRTIRTRLAVSQAEIGAALGVTQSNVSFYERGQTIPPEIARKLIDFARGRDLALTFDHVYGASELPVAAAPNSQTTRQAA